MKVEVSTDIQTAREQRKLSKRERKALARAKQGTNITHKTKVVQEPPLWLKSASMDAVTTPMFPTQVPFRPKVLYTDRAWAKLQHLINNNTLEVGWWGTVTKNGNTYTIDDIFVPKQRVSGATTDISADGLNKIVDDLLVSQGHADNLLYWGHLHPNFSCCPSATDERTAQEFVDKTDAGSYFIRGIYNKKGESKVDIYQKDSTNEGWIFQNIANERIPASLTEDELVLFKETCKANVESYVPALPPRNANGSFTKVIEDPSRPGLYKLREGIYGSRYGGVIPVPDSKYPSAAQDVIDDLDLGVIGYDDLEVLHDPHGVKGEGYGRS